MKGLNLPKRARKAVTANHGTSFLRSNNERGFGFVPPSKPAPRVLSLEERRAQAKRDRERTQREKRAALAA